MEKQTLIFTSLPNGFSVDGTARLSVFISPRLWSDAPDAGNLTLDHYPDLLHWPALVSALAWEASIDGEPALPLTVANNPLDPIKPELWAALFHDTTQVKPFQFEDYRGLEVQAYPIWSLYDTIASVYGRASYDPVYGAGSNRPGLDALASDTDLSAIARPSFPEPEPTWEPPQTSPVPFPDAPPVIERPEPQDTSKPRSKSWLCRFFHWLLCCLIKLLGLGVCDTDAEDQVSTDSTKSEVALTPSFKTDVTEPSAEPPPASGKTFLPPPLTPAQQETHAAFAALENYLKPFEGSETQLPNAEQLAETWDFHQAVSSLGDYPKMLRRLGFVIDFHLPVGTVLPDTGTIRISPIGGSWQPGTTILTPRTHFVSTPSLFTAAPRKVLPEISNGLLRVDDSARFRVIQNDVTGDAIKLQNAATHFLRFAKIEDRSGNMPGVGGLPALRTAGISLIRRDTEAELTAQFLRSCALNLFLAAQDLSPEPPPIADSGASPQPSDELFAEDLVRGYRIDVFDTKTATWRSLFEREGEYRFLDAVGGPAVELASDEAFVQFSATAPSDPAAQKLIRTSESLFTWSGWSLAAPRPGKSIMLGDNDVPDYPPNHAVTPFKIEVNFKAKPGSLPRLRFGRVYQLRARVADLAGNSVMNPGEPSFASDVPEMTAEFTAMRYEPVAPPILMLKAPPIEGESVERLVVRTPVIGGSDALSARHIAPPKTSQLMAELHGKFDSDRVNGSPAGYAMASRESNSINAGAQQTKPGEDGIWFQPKAHVTVKYLPDPQAHGVAFTGLPGEAGPKTIRHIPFSGKWPDMLPFRIELKAISTLPVAPVWDERKRVLSVELAPAQRATVRINSLFLDPGILDSRGVWKWTEEQTPNNLSEVRQSLLIGQHWAHLPWREITLLHAVQTPLAAPSITTLVPEKKLKETFVTMTGQIEVELLSTGRLQLLSKWTDPIDDPAMPMPGTQTLNAHICEIEVAEDVDPVDIKDSGTGIPPKQEFHDSKYHRVDYTPVAITRFREYFPTATNTPETTTLRGADFSVDVLNSLRPDAPKFLYALPLFDWDTPPGTAGITERTRLGGGLRIYLDRPWYSSGDGELLGIVFKEGAEFLTLDDSLKPLVTQWGADPIWDANPTPISAQKMHFHNALQIKDGLSLAIEDNPQPLPPVSVAGYQPVFDSSRQLWYADVKIDTGDTYWPFIRLALTIFQPKSVDDAHLSRVLRSDFIQLPPTRHTKISVSAAAIHVNIDGPVYYYSELMQTVGNVLPLFGGTPGSNGLSEIEAVLEQRDPTDDSSNELAWKPIEATRVLFFQDPSVPGKWEGDVTLSGKLKKSLFRLTIKEFEWYRTDDSSSSRPQGSQIRVARRVVFADVFAL